jgi:hypothetical protein
MKVTATRNICHLCRLRRYANAKLPALSPHRDMKPTPTSQILETLLEGAPDDQITLSWILAHLRTRSFGIVLLLLGILGLVPVVSPVAGVLISIPAYQMIRARPSPMFPRALAERSLPAYRFASMVHRIAPSLRFLERFVRPRWPTPFETTKRVIGVVVLALGIGLLAPFPLSNIPVGLAVILVAFAYLEEDGLMLAVSLIIAFALFAIGAMALWGSVSAMIAATSS